MILHVLDLSKTGLLAPSPGFLAELRKKYGRAVRYSGGCLPGAALGRLGKGVLKLDAVVLIRVRNFLRPAVRGGTAGTGGDCGTALKG